MRNPFLEQLLTEVNSRGLHTGKEFSARLQKAMGLSYNQLAMAWDISMRWTISGWVIFVIKPDNIRWLQVIKGGGSHKSSPKILQIFVNGPYAPSEKEQQEIMGLIKTKMKG
jgi:hypothetical protein